MTLKGLRRTLRKFIFIALPAFLFVLVIFTMGIRSYLSRPPFSGQFVLAHEKIFGDWERNRSVILSSDQVAYIDKWEHIILVSPVEPRIGAGLGRDIGWVPVKRHAAQLILRHLGNGKEVVIEWRRDCIVILNQSGTAIYMSLSPLEFDIAFSDPQNWTTSFSDLVRKYTQN